ncbi:ABC transporter protein [Mycena chlorophos]|uniref:ABC transporter protein n=1 Tax=Mycena chlorophos TaxID=658473 RepID=A0A8H6VXV9_MYCCL|nr:ABC transporter protein [Mycena chlorophos]
MNDLISNIFSDPYITLECQGGECLNFSQVPGYVRPPGRITPSGWRLVPLASGSLSSWRRRHCGAADERPRPRDATPTSHTLGSRVLLDNISGTVKPGQVCAIMGASGAGKSTFLNILARKAKRGIVGGTTTSTGREVADDQFKAVPGLIDQEDTLMSTLTVYETVLYSALLRLPRDMSCEAKKLRRLVTMNELGILGIKDSRIGGVGHRSISGGEKRRVSIACELFTSPSILFLDEPTRVSLGPTLFLFKTSVHNRPVTCDISAAPPRNQCLVPHLAFLPRRDEGRAGNGDGPPVK